jgi:hypothetical protein
MTQTMPQPGGGFWSSEGSFKFLSRQTRAEKVIADATLPKSIRSMILRVTRASRLWRWERADLAVELCAHFGDGLDAGRTAEQLIEEFGDPKIAGRLMGRGKKRCRPLAWHMLRWTGRSMAALLVVYIGFAIYYMTGQVGPIVDYSAQINAKAAAVPVEDRAWPIYRQALLPLKDVEEFPWDGYSRPPLPGETGWEKTEAFLDRHAQTLSGLRAAAQKPGLGYIATSVIAPEDRQLFGTEAPIEPQAVSDQHQPHMLIAILLPHMAKLRQASQLLGQSAIRSAAKGNGKEAIEDVESMLNVARHVRETAILINDLVAMAIVSQASTTTRAIVERYPAALNEDLLIRLAHGFAATNQIFRPRLDHERLGYRDLIQRLYTDDGNGDGRLVVQGIATWGEVGPLLDGGPGGDSDSVVLTALMPALVAIAPSRKQALDDYELIVGMQERWADKPLWEMDRRPAAAKFEQWKGSLRSKLRHLWVLLMAPALSRVFVVSELHLAERDATLVLIAVELHRKRHGQWPDSLEVLVPNMLPTMVRDRFDGAPLRYRLEKNGPVIYSVGVDRNDDGGRIAVKDEASGETQPGEAREWLPPHELASKRREEGGEGIADGDWVIFPMPLEKLEVELDGSVGEGAR